MTDKFSNVTNGDIVKFRCGGSAIVESIESDGSEHYPYMVMFKGHLGEPFSYSDDGECGQGTGSVGSPFDILEASREPRTMQFSGGAKDV